MHGIADRIASAQATQQCASQVSETCKLKLWEGFYHEIHTEPEKAEVLDYVVNRLREYAS